MICPTVPRIVSAHTTRCVHSGSPVTSYNKYVDRLQRKAKEQGLNIEELKSRALKETRSKQRMEAASLFTSFKKPDTTLPHLKSWSNSTEGAKMFKERKDSSPVKPLSAMLNLSKLVATPHAPSQVSALWTAYHASRTNDTGKGYICASVPVQSYNAMTRIAKNYPVFVIPIPRGSAPESGRCTGGNTDTAHEFFYLQWDFHPARPAASVSKSSPFEPVGSDDQCHVPAASTVLFTPLQEYKLRASFATPYLVLTFYTDLSQSHGIVLLRGEITPSSASVTQPGQETLQRFLLNQVDAQLLAMGLQRFYLWGGGGKETDHDPAAEALLKQFHEEPEKFNWQDLLK